MLIAEGPFWARGTFGPPPCHPADKQWGFVMGVPKPGDQLASLAGLPMQSSASGWEVQSHHLKIEFPSAIAQV